MAEVWTMGEILVEIMRPGPGVPLSLPGPLVGPLPSGAPAIFADTVARLGHEAGIVGGVGEDDFGRFVLERLAADGVDCSRVIRVPGRSTAVAFVSYAETGERTFIFHIDGTPAVMGRWTGEPDPQARFFHVMGCSLMAGEGLREALVATALRFHDAGVRLSFDPNLRPELLGGRSLQEVVGPVLERSSVLLPGATELALLAGTGDEKEAARRLLARPGLEVIAVKRGARGCTVITRGGWVDVPARAAVEVDPTGAGDAFDAAFVCGLLEGRTPEDCGRMAVAAGALAAEAFGPMEGRISREAVVQGIAHL